MTLVPTGFGMWLAHFLNPLMSGWGTLIPVIERILGVTSFGSAVASTPDWLPSLELLFLDLGLLLTLYLAWRVACRLTNSARPALAMLFPWAILTVGLYSAGLWIVFQPMQMRGMMMG